MITQIRTVLGGGSSATRESHLLLALLLVLSVGCTQENSEAERPTVRLAPRGRGQWRAESDREIVVRARYALDGAPPQGWNYLGQGRSVDIDARCVLENGVVLGVISGTGIDGVTQLRLELLAADAVEPTYYVPALAGQVDCAYIVGQWTVKKNPEGARSIQLHLRIEGSQRAVPPENSIRDENGK